MHGQTFRKPAAEPVAKHIEPNQPLALTWAKTFGLAVLLFAVSAYAIQEKPSSGDQENKQEAPKPDGPDKYAPLIQEFLNLESKLEQGVSFPAPRTQSKLMPLLPASTQIFASVPNFGAAVGQADQIFHQQLKERQVLADWWNTQAMAGMIVEDALAKVQQFSGYLGDEIVVAGTTEPRNETVIVLAEIRKPGLHAFLQGLVKQYAGQGSPSVVLLTPQQLLQTTRQRSNKPLMVLVRPDYMIASSSLSTLKSVNGSLTRGSAPFAATPFGQRLAQVYQSGAGVVFAADLQSLSKQRPHGGKDQETLYQSSGFDDLRFLTVNGQYGAGMLSANTELAFNGPRKGVASWLAAPAPVGGLDFVAPEASAAGAFVLKSPALVYDEIKNTATASNPKSASDLAEMEEKLKINFKEDLLSKLGGQIVVAIDGPIMPTPAWKIVLQVSDPTGLQGTVKKLVDAANAEAKHQDLTLNEQAENGVTYHTLHFVNKQKDQDVVYAFADGYMVVAATRSIVADAIAVHKSGKSLAKSGNLQELMPDSSKAYSALVYQNVAPMLAPVLAMQSPEMAPMLQPLLSRSKPSITLAYGEDSAIRVVARSHGFDMTMFTLVGAAVAIPNLMNSRKAANDATAVSTIRTLSTAQVTYYTTYAKYAPDIATLGPRGDGNCTGDGPSEQHACLLDKTFAKPDCTADSWCAKGAFRYNTTAVCKDKICEDYVVLATPTDAGGTAKSYCSTSDGVVRVQQGPPLTTPITAEECQSWQPQQ